MGNIACVPSDFPDKISIMGKKKKTEYYGVKEIARRAKVSIATVDRVIHNRTGVAEGTRQKINQIIKELDYQPNILASRLASRRVFHFATLIPGDSEETDFWKAPLAGILQAETEIKQYGVKIEKYFFDLNDKESFVKQAGIILKGKVDGILVAPSFIEESVRFIDVCRERKIPYVFINSDIPNRDSLCYIGPDLYHSGYLGARLTSYGVGDGKILIVNIAREMDNHHHLLRKEEGFRSWFRDHGKTNEIVKIDIRQTDSSSVERHLSFLLKEHRDIRAIFVTNSRVSAVAHYLEKSAVKEHILLIGYDFLEANIACLERNIIDFLICQKPDEQGYRGIKALYQSQVLGGAVEKEHFMPIDIITRENYAVYKN